MYARNSPWIVRVNKDTNVSICGCGLTATPPFCEQPGQSAACSVHSHYSKKEEILFVCGCGRSGDMPFCDGSHNQHPDNTPGRLLKGFLGELKR